MKFTDGYWNMRRGVTPHWATHADDVAATAETLTIYAPTKRLTGRGDTLNLPLLTVRLSSPAENVIRVQMWHHKGGRPRLPEFELLPQPAPEVTGWGTLSGSVVSLPVDLMQAKVPIVSSRSTGSRVTVASRRSRVLISVSLRAGHSPGTTTVRPSPGGRSSLR
jgi:alpha-D-xyloside xylohydrolase